MKKLDFRRKMILAALIFSLLAGASGCRIFPEFSNRLWAGRELPEHHIVSHAAASTALELRAGHSLWKSIFFAAALNLQRESEGSGN